MHRSSSLSCLFSLPDMVSFTPSSASPASWYVQSSWSTVLVLTDIYLEHVRHSSNNRKSDYGQSYGKFNCYTSTLHTNIKAQPSDRVQVYATKGDSQQLFELSLERLQADVDAWICEHADLAPLKPLSAHRLHPVEDRPHNLTARDHGDVWWHSVPTTKPQPCPTEAGLSKLTEANLEQLQVNLRQLDAKYLRTNTAPTAVPAPDVRGRPHKKAARNSPSSKVVPRPQFLTVGYQRSFSSEASDRLRVCAKTLTPQSSLGDLSSSPTSCGPSTPRDRSPSPCGDALPGMTSPSIAGSDTSSEDFQVRPDQLAQKAKAMTVQRRFVYKLKAALSAIRF